MYMFARDFGRGCVDIAEHMELLARLSSLCNHVTEFGVRYGASTMALMFGRPKELHSYDVNESPQLPNLLPAAEEAGVAFHFHRQSSLEANIESTDFLFIDSLHTHSHVRQELERHSGK